MKQDTKLDFKGSLFYSKHSNMNYFIVQDKEFPYCSICNKELTLGLLIRQYRYFKQWHIEYLCPTCQKKGKKSRFIDMDMKAVASIIEELPKGKLFAIKSLFEGMKSTRQILDGENFNFEQCIDRTKYAGKESLEGAKIGVMPEERPLLKDEKEVKNLLLDMKDGKNG